MEGLTTQQIILLTLFISFITSIATGIVTVALMEQAPDPLTQTINRVIERTVEKVVPDTGSTKTQDKEIVTVVVNNEDLTTESVSKNSKSLVRIFSQDGSVRNFVGMGIVTNNSGQVLVDSGLIVRSSRYIGVFENGESTLIHEYSSKDNGYTLLKIKENPNNIQFTPAVFGKASDLKLAQSVISMGGQERNSVSVGVVNELRVDSNKNVKEIVTSIDPGFIVNGSIIFTLKGDIVGIHKQNQNFGVFAPIYIPVIPTGDEPAQ